MNPISMVLVVTLPALSLGWIRAKFVAPAHTLYSSNLANLTISSRARLLVSLDGPIPTQECEEPVLPPLKTFF